MGPCQRSKAIGNRNSPAAPPELVTIFGHLLSKPAQPSSFPFLLIFNCRVIFNLIVQIQEIIHGLCHADFPDANIKTHD